MNVTRYICVTKCYQWSKLWKPGEIIDLPDDIEVPYGVEKRTKKRKPYFEKVSSRKRLEPKKMTALLTREIKELQNRMNALSGRTKGNLTPNEVGELERIKIRLAQIGPIDTAKVAKTKQEIVEEKENLVGANVARDMSMQETQDLRHSKSQEE